MDGQYREGSHRVDFRVLRSIKLVVEGSPRAAARRAQHRLGDRVGARATVAEETLADGAQFKVPRADVDCLE